MVNLDRFSKDQLLLNYQFSIIKLELLSCLTLNLEQTEFGLHKTNLILNFSGLKQNLLASAASFNGLNPLVV